MRREATLFSNEIKMLAQVALVENNTINEYNVSLMDNI